MYWGGGSGDWNDVNHWFKEADGINITGILPDANTTVIFSDQ